MPLMLFLSRGKGLRCCYTLLFAYGSFVIVCVLALPILMIAKYVLLSTRIGPSYRLEICYLYRLCTYLFSSHVALLECNTTLVSVQQNSWKYIVNVTATLSSYADNNTDARACYLRTLYLAMRILKRYCISSLAVATGCIYVDICI